jgi:hypothetical protein
MRALSEAEPHPRGIQPSSKAESRPRGRPALERGGVSPEGASNARARRRFVSAALYPSSEMEFRPRERALTVLVGR